MTLNAAWHRLHAMPKNATLAQRVAWHRAHQEHCACRPIPAKLLEQMTAAGARTAQTKTREARTTTSPEGDGTSLKALLSGGDRRSLAQSKRAHALVEGDPARVAELAELAQDTDPLVAMRALDLLEKLTHEHADWVQPHKRLFIGPLAESESWELRLQVVRSLPLLRWTRRERTRVLEILRRDVAHPQKFVRAWALDSLATFSSGDPALQRLVKRLLREFEQSGSKALATRAQKIRARLASTAR